MQVVDDRSANKMLLVMDYLEGGPVMTREGLGAACAGAGAACRCGWWVGSLRPVMVREGLGALCTSMVGMAGKVRRCCCRRAGVLPLAGALRCLAAGSCSARSSPQSMSGKHAWLPTHVCAQSGGTACQKMWRGSTFEACAGCAFCCLLGEPPYTQLHRRFQGQLCWEVPSMRDGVHSAGRACWAHRLAWAFG